MLHKSYTQSLVSFFIISGINRVLTSIQLIWHIKITSLLQKSPFSIFHLVPLCSAVKKVFASEAQNIAVRKKSLLNIYRYYEENYI